MSILTRKRKQQQEEIVQTIDERDVVQIITDCEGDPRRIGRVERIAISPYYREECEGVLRAYIVPLDPKEGWTDWVLEIEVRLLAKAAAFTAA